MGDLIRKNMMDHEQFTNTYEGSEILKKMHHQNKMLIDDLYGLMENTFYLLYKIWLIFEPPQSYSVSQMLLETLSEEDALQKLRLRTSGSKLETYLALKFLLDDLLYKLKGNPLLNDIQDKLKDLSFKKLNHCIEQIPNHLIYSPEEMAKLKSLSKSKDLSAADVFTKALNDLLSEGYDPEVPIKTGGPKDENALNRLIHQLKKPEEKEESEANFKEEIEAIIKKEGAVDESYRESLKDDLENRFSPYLKNYLLSSGNSPKVVDASISNLAGGDDVHRQIILPGAANGHTEPIRQELIYEADAIKSKLSKALKIGDALKSLPLKIDAFNQSALTLGIRKESLNTLSFDEAIDLYKRFNDPKFIRFVNKVGKNKKHARQMVYKQNRDKVSPIDKVHLSNQIDGLIDDELISLSLDIEAFDNDFYERYMRDDLLTIKMVAKKDKRRGPIVLCYDGSGSMQGVKIEETKAHVLAILEIAKIQKRPLVLIQFASKTEPLFIKHINPLNLAAKDVMDVIDTFICGGTDFEKPLEQAMTFITASKYKNGDILFITDGQCDIHADFKEKFIQLKNVRSFKLYTVIIHSYTYGDYGDLGEISDEVLEIKESDMGNWNDETNSKLFALI